jgi:ABC-type sugar transport system substrate-binding protein
MAIGAIIALQQAGKDPKKIVVGGVDATRDALAEMEKGNLAVTVFPGRQRSGQGCGGFRRQVGLPQKMWTRRAQRIVG